jgi:TRAP-type uncharacterized transport system fused permease subunit
MAVEGYYRRKLLWYERIISIAGSIMLIDSGGLTDLIGLTLIGIIILTNIKAKIEPIVPVRP